MSFLTIVLLLSSLNVAFGNPDYYDDACEYSDGYSMINISSLPVTNWGDWGKFEKCPCGTYVQGVQLKVDKYRGNMKAPPDDTALNGVKFFCGDPFDPKTVTITSTVGHTGSWGSIFSCFPGYIYAFQLRAQCDQGLSKDDTAADNLRIFCSISGWNEQFIQLDGVDKGLWGGLVQCPCDHSFCGIQTQVQPFGGNAGGKDALDETSLNNIRVGCCEFCYKYQSDQESEYEGWGWSNEGAGGYYEDSESKGWGWGPNEGDYYQDSEYKGWGWGSKEGGY